MENAAPAITVKCLPKRHKRFAGGHPWLYSNEIVWPPGLKTQSPGTRADFYDAGGEFLARGFFNPKSLIAGRVLTRNRGQEIDAEFFNGLFRSAMQMRDRFFKTPYYRLIHAEADGMPGLVVDRFGDLLVCEVNTAGMEQLMPVWMPVLQQVTGAKTVYLNNDSNSRNLEGLRAEKLFYTGELTDAVLVHENELKFYADIVSGQKTGWFYDQRANRAMVGNLCGGGKMLDLYSYLGGFALCAAKSGAESVVAVDRSQQSMQYAEKSAALNGLAPKCRFLSQDVFEFLESQKTAKETFDVIVADPPAFAKAAKDIPAAKIGYRKLAQMCARVSARGGFLFIASCSHHMNTDDFIDAVASGIDRAGRNAKILRQTSADCDHPVHVHLPQSAYLKGFLLQLD